jgi:LPS export ABC transporter protein LptC
MKTDLFTYLLPLITIIALSSCGNKSNEALEFQEYNGPVIEIGPAVNYYSDSAVVKMRMEAPRQLEFGNGDREFPEGLYLEFFENGEMTSTLKADYCYYTKEDDLYKATGNVIIKRVSNGDRLDTEELYWSQKDEDVFTDKNVIIQQEGELIKGVGLEAKQDFSYYKILEVTGTLPLSKENEQDQ